MSGILVEAVVKIKFLGVISNSTLSWSNHILESVSMKLSSCNLYRVGCLKLQTRPARCGFECSSGNSRTCAQTPVYFSVNSCRTGVQFSATVFPQSI
eukprot:sb/3479056/